MSHNFSGSGRLGRHPVIKFIKIDGVKQPVAELRVYFDKFKEGPDGFLRLNGGTWLNVILFVPGVDNAVRFLRRGVRVHVTGDLIVKQTAKKGLSTKVNTLQINGKEVFLSLTEVDQITYLPIDKNFRASVS